MTYEEIPGGCYTPEHWKVANGIDLRPENNGAHEAGSKGRIKPYLTEESLDEYLSANGITVRLNVITHEVEAGGVECCYNPESTRNDLPVILYDELKQRFCCDKQTLCDLLNLIAGRNRYNPVLELIDLCEWDGEDYLGQLVDILGIREDDTLSQTLLYKWAVQCYQLLHNQIGLNVSADGMLVLQGPQGCGKTSFVRQIGIRPDFVKLHDISERFQSIRCDAFLDFLRAQYSTMYKSVYDASKEKGGNLFISEISPPEVFYCVIEKDGVQTVLSLADHRGRGGPRLDSGAPVSCQAVFPAAVKDGADTAGEASHRQGNCRDCQHQAAGLCPVPCALSPEVPAGKRTAPVRLDVSDPVGKIQGLAVQLQQSAQGVPHADDTVGALHPRKNRNGPMMSDWRTVNGP